MPSGPTSKAAADGELQSPGLSREEIVEPAREPLEDHSGSSWGAWGRDQVAPEDDEESLVNVLNATGSEPRKARRGETESVAAQDFPQSLQNPTARDLRMEPHETDEARMATEAPGTGG
jgi:hypothetical protein